MGDPSILGMLAAFTCAAVAFCLVIPLFLLRRIGECQAEAGAENALFPGAPTSRRMRSADA